MEDFLVFLGVGIRRRDYIGWIYRTSLGVDYADPACTNSAFRELSLNFLESCLHTCRQGAKLKPKYRFAIRR